MIGVPENAFFHTLLRPIACITSSCRPSGRKSSHDESCSTEPIHRLNVATSAKALDQPHDQQAYSHLLDDRKRLLHGSERGRVELNQPECCFLKLPIEVRLMIYHYVLCVPVPIVHIVRRKDGALCHVRCRASKGDCGTYRCYNDYSELSRTTKSRSTPEEGDFGPLGGLLSLAFTCKKIFSEAIHTAYSENTFSFFDLPVIDDFSSAIPQERLNTVQRIQFEYKLYSTIRHFFPSLAPALGETLTWPRVRQILSGMQGLREIHVKVAKTPEAYGTPGMVPEVIRITDFVADRTDGASEAMMRLLEVKNVEVMIEEVP